MLGDIVADEASILCARLACSPPASLGDGSRGRLSRFMARAPDIAGQGIANPYGSILSAALLLRHSLRLEQEAQAVERAVHRAIDDGVRTPDIVAPNHRPATTQEAGTAVLAALT